MATIPINFQLTYEQPFVTGIVILDGKQYRVRIDYTPRRVGAEGLEPPNTQNPDLPRRELGTFFMTWFNSANVLIISAMRVRLGTDLLRLYKYNQDVPQGSLDVVALSESGFEPTRGIPATFAGTQGTDFGRRVVMRYVTAPPLTVLNIPVSV